MSGGSDRIRDALQFVPADDRDTWLSMGMAVKAELGDCGFDIWNAWSQGAEAYRERDARDVWRSIRQGGGIGVGTLFHEAKQHGWHDNHHHQGPAAEELAERRREAKEQAEIDAANVERERVETARKAAAIWQRATAARANHPYLERKRVSPVATLREIDAGAAAAILGYTPKSGGEPLTGRLLVVPVKQGDGLSTLELVDESGCKAALAGRGTKAGGYWAAQPLPRGDGPEPLLVGEGVATVLTASAATGCLAVAALSSGNLGAVAQVMRQRYPTRPIVILADLVKTTGEPDRHAMEAARAVGGKLAVPNFGPDREPWQTDFNDFARNFRPEAVKQIVDGALFQGRNLCPVTPKAHIEF